MQIYELERTFQIKNKKINLYKESQLLTLYKNNSGFNLRLKESIFVQSVVIG